MKKFIYFFSLFTVIAILTLSCGRDENIDRTSTVTAIVFEKYVDYAIPPDFTLIKAIKIKESNSGEWITIVGIDGFNYEENFEYKLKLEKTYLADPPLDSPSNITYRLLEILTKTPK